MPFPLPPGLESSIDLLRAAERARGVLGELVGHARLIANIELVTRALSLREAVLSSRMEGTETTVAEVLIQEATKAIAAEDTDLHEVNNYLRTVQLAEEWLRDGRQVRVPFVKDLHARLLRGVRGEERNPGGLRRKNVYIGARHLGLSGARFVPPPVEHVESLIEELFGFTSGERTYGPLIDCAIAHYQFETIHPFEDGNGRLGRLLIPVHLIDWGVMDRPLLYLGPFFESHSDEYRDGLLAVSRYGAWNAWVVFFLNAIHDTAADALVRATRIVELREDYRRRVTTSVNSKYAFTALDRVFQSVAVSAGLIQEATGTTAPTARRIIDAMVHAGILRLDERIGGTQYWVASELLSEVYAE